MLPLTAEVQRAIHAHQNPADCSKARFLIHSTIPSGVASIMNVETVSLVAALNSGRIMHEEYDHLLTQNGYCRGNATLDSCYFEPLTRCRLTREEAAAAPTLKTVEQLMDPSGPRVGILDYNLVAELRLSVPKQFEKQVEERGIPSKRKHYWWRAQAIAYIIRPNARTRAELEKRKQERFRGAPLAPGCISLFVRGGDKAAESAVFSSQHYEGIVQRLRQIDPALTNQLFITTEDPRTIDYFANSSSWRTSYVHMKEEEGGTRDDAEYLRSLLNLDLALQCDGYVGSFFSNWQRLIDEMRVTVRCKANAVYVDAHYKTPAEMDFNW
ncbi:hypothetical protein OEZ86_000312 [Tetradesmus obliquus]|nr:hypothetical protein OEZ86_000312 [Tetradesmus obliquus]